MKYVGLILSSFSASIWRSKRSVFSKHPYAVPVITASGISTPACSKAVREDNSELFISFPIRLAAIGLTYLRISDNSSSDVISTFDRTFIFISGLYTAILDTGLFFEMISDVSLPPKPNELQTTLSSLISSTPSVGVIPPSIWFCQPRFAGTKPCFIANRQITVSIPPDALVVCPVNDLVLETRGIHSPNTRFKATPSLWSLFGVPVP